MKAKNFLKGFTIQKKEVSLPSSKVLSFWTRGAERMSLLTDSNKRLIAKVQENCVLFP